VNHELDCKSKKYFVIPYIHKILKTITSLINKSEFIVGFKEINKLNNFIKVQKDKTNYMSENNVVYKLLCNDCDVFYVEQTKRQVKTRINT